MRWPGDGWRGAVLLLAGLCGCAMPEAVLKADELYTRGDTVEAAEAYSRAIQDVWLTQREFAHASERLKEVSATELQRRLRLMETRLALRPAEELLGELSKLRAEQARKVGDPEQDQLLTEVMRRVVARDWPEVEALLGRGRYREALARAYKLAVFFPRRDALWREVERLEEAARTWPELPEVPEPPFPPEAEAYLRIVQENLEAGRPDQARVALVLAATAADMPVDTFMARVSALYGVYAPFLLQPPPPAPELTQDAQLAERPLQLVHGKTGRSAASWRSLPTADAVVARGTAGIDLQYAGIYLLARDIPTQQDRQAALFSYRMEMAVLSAALDDVRGWTLQDQFLLELFVGKRTSAAHVYSVGSSSGGSETGFCFGGVVGWTLLAGWRGPHVGLLVGARAQSTGYQVGDVTAGGSMLPLVAWLELRWNERYPIVLEGWVSPWNDVRTSRGVRVRIPISRTWGLFGRFEEQLLESRMGGLNRKDRIDIGQRPSTLVSLGFSMPL